MKGIISSRATSFRLPFPTVRKTVLWTSNLRTTCLLNASPPPSLKRLFFRCQNRRREQGLRGNLVGGLVVVRCGVTEINESQFQETVLKSDVPVLVEFVAGWCGPCRLISPLIDWVSEEYKDKLKVVKIDHDASPQLIEQYKVYGLPTLILFKNGQEVPESRKEGAITKVKLKEYLDALLESASVI